MCSTKNHNGRNAPLLFFSCQLRKAEDRKKSLDTDAGNLGTDMSCSWVLVTLKANRWHLRGCREEQNDSQSGPQHLYTEELSNANYYMEYKEVDL